MIAGEKHIETARERGVREEHLTLSHGKHTDTRELFAEIARITRYRGEVVLDHALSDLVRREGHVEVVVEIALEGRHPVEAPAHAVPVGANLGKRSSRYCNDLHVMVLEVLRGSVNVLGLERTSGAGGLPFGREHQMMHDKLSAALEEFGERAGSP